ncbi:hypothetical protein R0833_17120 [Bacillus amyloliquefaciens]|uniref:hypothetical protein n=1 Tax=Bacillus amyloliquefaciens group TaxID=1938374 RepID=UPI001921D925|nr:MULTISPECIES: hypothetical protein [Bacillus amyloliquefaciens group]MBL3612668.1 hypothetical protein [Bacillus sp. RHFS18]MBM7030596.1 hypothetical protein [Bacillus velezensis]WOH97231.1 hypothetical protein R0744_18845 [Bacillus amyloliquefaciens]WOI49629.1 hypothetical protein R0833_17120 [Bacillus amyloliquefaciens]WOI65441.1 hypothetical protein R0887_17635 [Bacillus amyloliquefaciens]
MKLKVLFKFKDGMLFESELDGSEGDFVKTIVNGKKNNATLTLNGNIVRRYDELYSVEFVM